MWYGSKYTNTATCYMMQRGSQFNFKGFNMPDFSNVSSIIIIENSLRYNPRIVEDMTLGQAIIHVE